MKSHFPIINYFEKKHIIYADSAATTLKLKTVIDSVSNFYSFETSKNLQRFFAELMPEKSVLEQKRPEDLVNLRSSDYQKKCIAKKIIWNMQIHIIQKNGKIATMNWKAGLRKRHGVRK